MEKSNRTEKIICLSVTACIIIFSIIYIVLTTFGNPIENITLKNIILNAYCIYIMAILAFWIYCIVYATKHIDKKPISTVVLIVGSISFFTVPPITGEPILYHKGTLMLLVNIAIWFIYFAKHRDRKFLLLTIGTLVTMMALPYCNILWD